MPMASGLLQGRPSAHSPWQGCAPPAAGTLCVGDLLSSVLGGFTASTGGRFLQEGIKKGQVDDALCEQVSARASHPSSSPLPLSSRSLALSAGEPSFGSLLPRVQQYFPLSLPEPLGWPFSPTAGSVWTPLGSRWCQASTQQSSGTTPSSSSWRQMACGTPSKGMPLKRVTLNLCLAEAGCAHQPAPGTGALYSTLWGSDGRLFCGPFVCALMVTFLWSSLSVL